MPLSLAFLVRSVALTEQNQFQPCTGDVGDGVRKTSVVGRGRRGGGGRVGGGAMARMVQASLVL